MSKHEHPLQIHKHGGERLFVRGLAEGKLLSAKCANPLCDSSGKEGSIHLPPLLYCPDCSEAMEWQDIADLARRTAKVHKHLAPEGQSTESRTTMTCELISVEIEGVATALLSQLRGAQPAIGLPIEPVFNTDNPTFTILDLSWQPRRSSASARV